MSATLTTFLFEAVNFVVLAAVLGWFFFKPVRQALDERRATLAAQTAEAAARMAEAERVRAQLAEQRQALAGELAQMRQEAHAAAQREADTIRAEARAQAQRERQALRHELASLSQAQTGHLARGVAAAVHAVARHLFNRIRAPELDLALVRAACQELASLNGAALALVTVESAQPLAAEAREALATVLGPVAAHTSYHVVPDLMAGVRIMTNQGIIDASAAGLAAYAERILATELEALTRDEANYG